MSRTYERTHKWITFKLPLNSFAPEIWLLVGEARSKCEHLAGVPLRPETARMLHQVYLAKGVQGTTAIEGNTLSEQQVEAIIEGKLKLPPSKAYLEQEVKNVVSGCDAIWELVQNRKRVVMTPEIVCSFNKMVLNALKLDDDVVPGRIRRHDVGVFRYKGAPPEDCEFLLGRLCEWLREAEQHMPDYLGRLGKAVLLAVIAHLYIAWIHPFGDGNGRTARLLEFAILLEAGVPTPAAQLLSNHYNATRSEYYRQLDFASKSGGDVQPFILYALQGLVDELRSQIAVVRDQQLDVVWRNYVYERFKNREDSPGLVRAKHLVLDLALLKRFVPKKELTAVSARVMRDYHGKADRTLTRDLNVLLSMELIVHDTKQGYRARREAIEAFLPGVKTGELEEPPPARPGQGSTPPTASPPN